MTFNIRIAVTVPKTAFKNLKFVEAIENAQMTKTKPALEDWFEKTVAGWQKRPQFEHEQISNSERISIAVFPFGRNKGIYEMVTRGVSRHTITARRPSGMLRFQTGYVAATQPGSLISGKAHRYGDFLRTYYVEHPGFPARDFDALIVEKIADDFVRDMQTAMNGVVEAI